MRRLPESWTKTVAKLGFRGRCTKEKRKNNRHRAKLGIESLEQRRVLATLTVNTDMDIVNPSDNLLSLREAIEAVNNQSDAGVPNGQIPDRQFGVNDTIVFDLTTGEHTIELDFGELGIQRSVEIEGPGSGVLTINAGGGDGVVGNGDGNRIFRVMPGIGSSINTLTVRMSGLRLTGGDVSSTTSGQGGAIIVAQAPDAGLGPFIPIDLTLDGMRIDNNFSSSRGGAVSNLGSASRLEIVNSVIENNSTASDGGAIAISGGEGFVSLDQAPESSRNLIRNTVIAGNRSGVGMFSGQGGAIWAADQTGLVIEGTTLERNEAVSGAGGGIFYQKGVLILRDTTIAENKASSDGGGIYVEDNAEPEVYISGSSIHHNQAVTEGGGFYYCPKFLGDLDIVNTTFSHNVLTGENSRGGGLFLGTGLGNGGDPLVDALLVNTTVVHNEADRGAGIFALFQGSDDSDEIARIDLTLHNSVVALNAGINDIDAEFNDNNPDDDRVIEPESSHNLIGVLGANVADEITDETNDNLILDAQELGVFAAALGPLQLNGGTTATHALLAGSIAIDAGDNERAIDPLNESPFEHDQRGVGFDRFINAATGQAGGAVDIGAYELQEVFLPPLVVTTSEDELDDTTNLGAFDFDDLSLREALSIAAAAPGHDTITFDEVLFSTPQTITLTYDGPDSHPFIDPLRFDSDVTVQGLGADLITIDGRGFLDARLLVLGSSVEISGLTIASVRGGISAGYAGLTLRGVRVIDNAGNGSLGQGVSAYNSDLRIVDSEIADNESYGVYFEAWYSNETYTLDIANSTISGNGDSGLFVWNEYAGANVLLANNTITDNTAASGAGIHFFGPSQPTVDIYNTIVVGNSDANGVAQDIAGSFTYANALGNNLVGADTSGFFSNEAGFTPADLLLAPLSFNGGPTRTHRLLPGSFAIDAGNDAQAVDGQGNALATDQRGRSRFINAVDVGAIEQDLLGDYDGSGEVDLGDFLLLQTRFESGEGLTVDLTADGDGSGMIDINDFYILSSHFGNTPDGTPLSASHGLQLVSTAIDEVDGDTSPGNLSLREALANASASPGDDIVVFRHELQGQPLQLATGLGELVIDSNVDLLGPGADLITIDAADGSRVLNVSSGVASIVRNLTLTGGLASMGGAIYSKGDLTVIESVLRGNHATISGGAIYQSGGSLLINRTTIDDNEASYAGGGLAVSSVDSVDITDSTLSRNTADYVGGVWVNNANLNVANSTISTNTARLGYGGGALLYGQGRTAAFTNATITNNSAGTGAGGGLYVSLHDVTLNNTIVAGNTGAAGDDDVFGNFNTFSAFNLIGAIDGSSGLTGPSNIIGTRDELRDAGLAALAYNGGSTETHALLDGSLAIDAGDDTLANAIGLFEDQRGEYRFADGDEDGDSQIDIGAFELAFDESFVGHPPSN